MKTREISDSDLIIKFPNKKTAKHFASWLCGVGEQHYWEWMRSREDEELGNITAVEFHYHGEEDQTKDKTDPSRYGEFMKDNIIRTTIGRYQSKRSTMKYLLMLLLVFVSACHDPVTKQVAVDMDSKVTINGKICDVIRIERGDRNPLYYIDCPDGSSTSYSTGGKHPVIMSTSSNKIDDKTVEAPMPIASSTSSAALPVEPLCHCKCNQ